MFVLPFGCRACASAVLSIILLTCWTYAAPPTPNASKGKSDIEMAPHGVAGPLRQDDRHFDDVIFNDANEQGVSQLYVVLTQSEPTQDRRSELVIEYANAAIQEAKKHSLIGMSDERGSPQRRATIVFVVRDSRKSKWAYHTGFAIEQLQEIALAEPDKARRLASEHAWIPLAVPKTAHALEATSGITVLRQTEEEYRNAALHGVSTKGRKVPRVGTISADLQRLTDQELRGRRLAAILPLKEIKAICVAYPFFKQDITERMSDEEIIAVYTTARLLAPDDMKDWHAVPGGQLILTTDSGDAISVGLLLGNRGRIAFADRVLYFQFGGSDGKDRATTSSR